MRLSTFQMETIGIRQDHGRFSLSEYASIVLSMPKPTDPNLVAKIPTGTSLAADVLRTKTFPKLTQTGSISFDG